VAGFQYRRLADTPTSTVTASQFIEATPSSRRAEGGDAENIGETLSAPEGKAGRLGFHGSPPVVSGAEVSKTPPLLLSANIGVLLTRRAE
jgi:hypothetical protein